MTQPSLDLSSKYLHENAKTLLSDISSPLCLQNSTIARKSTGLTSSTLNLSPKPFTPTSTASNLWQETTGMNLASPVNLLSENVTSNLENQNLNCKLLTTTTITTAKKAPMHSKAVVLKRPIRYIDDFDGAISNLFEPYEKKRVKFEIPQSGLEIIRKWSVWLSVKIIADLKLLK